MTSREIVATERHVIAPAEVPDQAAALLNGGCRVALITGHEDTPGTGRVVYLFTAPAAGASPERRVELQVPLGQGQSSRGEARVPSIAALSFPAGLFERELRDRHGIVADGHPMPEEISVDGPGVYEIPVGPVHAGMIGPGHFRFSVVGETILHLLARLQFTHRGVEKQFAGRTLAEGAELAARVSGDTTAGHTLAFCLAAENALGLVVPEREQWLRALVCELERLYNHVADIGMLCNDVGHGILNAHASRIRERLLRLNDTVTGHRLLRGAIYPGGACVRALPAPGELESVEADIAEVADLALGHAVVRDRFTGTAVLSRDKAAGMGTLGYVARASGVRTDARHDHPLPGVSYPEIAYSRTEGDVLSRFLIRAEEIGPSVRFVAEAVRRLDGYRGTPPAADIADRSAEPRSTGETETGAGGEAMGRSGIGVAEGWRGTIVHRVEADRRGRLARVKIVDPSVLNWPALPVAMNGTIVPDFPLANKSFNLSYAGNDL